MGCEHEIMRVCGETSTMTRIAAGAVLVAWQLSVCGCSVSAAPPENSSPKAVVGEKPVAAPRSPLEEWSTDVELRGWKYVVLHHSATVTGNVAEIDAAHRQRLDENGVPWRGVGYHFVIGNGHGMGDGAIEPTFRWKEQADGAHAGVGQFNELGIGVCLIGDFENDAPTPAQLASARRLVAALKSEFRIGNDRILCHRDLKPTACPGSRLPLDEIVETSKTIVQTSGTAP
jgi:hypothetical protein